MKTSPLSVFKFFSVAETITWASLIAALIIRAIWGVPTEVFFAVGSAHGLAFLGFGVVSILVGINQRWSVARTISSAALAVIPFATIPFEKGLHKRGLLDGEWRTTATGHPGDTGFVDMMFRWFIVRPAVLLAILTVLIGAIFAFLLWLGPPGEWGN